MQRKYQVIGLVLEDESPEVLMKRVTEAAPELIRLNNLPKCKAINFSINKSLRNGHETAA